VYNRKERVATSFPLSIRGEGCYLGSPMFPTPRPSKALPLKPSEIRGASCIWAETTRSFTLNELWLACQPRFFSTVKFDQHATSRSFTLGLVALLGASALRTATCKKTSRKNLNLYERASCVRKAYTPTRVRRNTRPQGQRAYTTLSRIDCRSSVMFFSKHQEALVLTPCMSKNSSVKLRDRAC